jgi:outer membrane protein assembly factor BamB
MKRATRYSVLLFTVVLAGYRLGFAEDREAARPVEPTTAAGGESPAQPTASRDDWPLFRGDPRSTGIARGQLPDQLTLLWKFTVEKGAFEGTPVIVDGVVYIGDLDGKVYAIDLKSGQSKWTHETNSGFLASPAVSNGRLYIGDYDGMFYCLDCSDGKKLWEYESQAEIDSGANFFGENVLFGSQDATLYCLNAGSGAVVWKHEIEDQIRCTPTIVEGRCFVAGCDGRLHIIDLNKGVEEASVDIQAPTGVTPAALGSRVFFGTEGSTFFCIDWKKAEVAWTFSDEDSGQPFRSSPAVTEQVVVVGGRNKRVHALNPDNGTEIWRFAAKSRVDASPVIAGKRVFAASADGRLVALDLQTGRQLWEYETGGGFTGSPAVAAGCLIIANDDGVVYCFGTSVN